MKKAYWLVQYRALTDESALKEYIVLAEAAVAAGGGKLLLRARDGTVPPGPKPVGRAVVIEFDNLEQAIGTRNSDSYQRALAVLGHSAVRDFRIMEAA
ncbi:DUF1330 domain-containing protein [Undibacterium sp.]|uniref:DUF1330 domain-containing protein n=1 Tax=Undibacterium sp. TaxID=1914977 RepID=UPI00374D2FA2